MPQGKSPKERPAAAARERGAPVSLKQIRYFIAAAESGRISQAAIDLNVSQSAVTAAVQQLEAMLGVRLFDRRPSGVSLTREGSRFLLHGRNVMAALAEAVREPRAAGASASGHVRVGVTYTVSGYFLPPHHARFSASYPEVTLSLYEASRDAIERGVIDGALDIAVMLVSNLQARETLASEVLVRSRRRLWAPVDHPLLRKETVGLDDVARYPYVMLTVDEANHTSSRYWKRTPWRPDVIFRTSSVEAVRSMVAAGMGITVLSDLVYRPWSLEGQRLETRTLQDEVPTMDVGLAWHAAREPSAAMLAFRDFLHLACLGAAD